LRDSIIAVLKITTKRLLVVGVRDSDDSRRRVMS